MPSVKAAQACRPLLPSPTACTRSLSREPTRWRVAPKGRPKRLSSQPWPMPLRPTKQYAGRRARSRGAKVRWEDLTRPSWLHDAIPYRVPNECSGRREVELAHDGGTMRFDGLLTDFQQTRDLLVGVTLGDQLNHATLAMRQ